MKTTLDLPDHLVCQVKQRALLQGRTFEELVAEYIRQGLHGSTAVTAPAVSDGVRMDLAGLPVFRCEPSSGTAGIDPAAALQLEQECLMQEDRRRAGLPA